MGQWKCQSFIFRLTFKSNIWWQVNKMALKSRKVVLFVTQRGTRAIAQRLVQSVTLLKTLCNAGRLKKQSISREVGEFSFCVIYCCSPPSEWINQSDGLGTLLVSLTGGERAGDGWSESPHIGKWTAVFQNQNPTWWEGSEVALHCDSALLVTLA